MSSSQDAGAACADSTRAPRKACHLAWGQGCDAHDIAEHDWPSVIQDIQSALYGALEPIPVNVSDLADLAATRPAGLVSTKLAWPLIDADGLERLILNIFDDAPGYENAQSLMHTTAPDRGRDVSVDRVITDSLGGVTRQRVIVQCKHWLSRSVAPSDVTHAVAAVKLWEPPPVDVLIVTTTGRFPPTLLRGSRSTIMNGSDPSLRRGRRLASSPFLRSVRRSLRSSGFDLATRRLRPASC